MINGKIKKRNQVKTSLEDKVLMVIVYTVMVILAVVTLYPMLYVVFASFSDPVRFAKHTGILLAPVGFSLIGYESVIGIKNVWIGYRNTIFYVLAGTSINMILTVIGAYCVSKPFKLRRPVMLVMIFTMYFSGGMIPTYLTVQNMGLTGTVWSVLIPGCVSIYNLIILRTAFEGGAFQPDGIRGN